MFYAPPNVKENMFPPALTTVNNSLLVDATDYSKFDLYLHSLGLPKDNILATPAEREIIRNNFPAFAFALPATVKRDSVYLSKFVAASSIGLFDAALNYIWNEVVINLRKKAVIYGLDLFFDAGVGGKNRDLFSSAEDLAYLKDKVLLDTCFKLELISELIYKKLTHILIMRNDIGASHPNDSSINAFELMGWLHVCVQDVIQDTPSEAAIQVKAFIDNLKMLAMPVDALALGHMQNSLRELHTKNTDNLLLSVFGIYVGAGANNVLKKNVSLIAPMVWANASENVKYKIGVSLDGYKTNLHIDKFESGNEFFDFCKGNQYKSLEARVIALDELVDELISAHNGWDNFHHEVPPARRLSSYIATEADIPFERRDKLVHAILKCRIGNGVSYNGGVSPLGRQIYDEILGRLGDNNIVQLLILMYSADIRIMLPNLNCKMHAVAILQLVRGRTVSEKILQILDFLIARAANLENAMNSVEFKTLASTHIKFG
jgi:hypothetical protein